MVTEPWCSFKSLSDRNAHEPARCSRVRLVARECLFTKHLWGANCVYASQESGQEESGQPGGRPGVNQPGFDAETPVLHDAGKPGAMVAEPWCHGSGAVVPW